MKCQKNDCILWKEIEDEKVLFQRMVKVKISKYMMDVQKNNISIMRSCVFRISVKIRPRNFFLFQKKICSQFMCDNLFYFYVEIDFRENFIYTSQVFIYTLQFSFTPCSFHLHLAVFIYTSQFLFTPCSFHLCSRYFNFSNINFLLIYIIFLNINKKNIKFN